MQYDLDVHNRHSDRNPNLNTQPSTAPLLDFVVANTQDEDEEAAAGSQMEYSQKIGSSGMMVMSFD